MGAMPVLVLRSPGVRLALLTLALLASAAVFAPLCQAAPGDLDPTFGTGGSERLFQNPQNTFFGAVTTQADGKVVMAGSNELAGVVLVRLLEDGAVDPSFGDGGVVSTSPFPGEYAEAAAVVVQPDGKIVIAGTAEVATNEDFLVARYLSDGRLDPSFGGGGIVTFPVGAEDDNAYALATGAGGRILVTGTTHMGGAEMVAVAVLRPNGELDPSFSADGVTTVESTVKADEGTDIAEAPGGDVVVSDESGAGGGHGFTIIRLLPSGTPDPTFGTAGIAQTLIPGGAAGRSTAVAVQPDGRIVAAGYGVDEVSGVSRPEVAVARYLTDGELDPGFGGGGTGFFTAQLGGEEGARFLTLTSTGKVYVAGDYEPAEGNGSPFAIRLTSAGLPDPTFGGGGVLKRPVLAPSGDYLESAALDPSERLVLLSNAHEGSGTVSVEVTRVLGDIAPPSPPASPATPTPAPPVANKPPHARINAPGKKVDAAKLKGFSGTASDPEGGSVRQVQIALVRKAPGKPKATAAAVASRRGGKTCLDLKSAKGGFRTVHAKKGKACPLLWLNAAGTAKWSFRLTGSLAPGNYVLYARATDDRGLAESIFSAAAGNRAAFRVTAAG